MLVFGWYFSIAKAHGQQKPSQPTTSIGGPPPKSRGERPPPFPKSPARPSRTPPPPLGPPKTRCVRGATRGWNGIPPDGVLRVSYRRRFSGVRAASSATGTAWPRLVSVTSTAAVVGKR